MARQQAAGQKAAGQQAARQQAAGQKAAGQQAAGQGTARQIGLLATGAIATLTATHATAQRTGPATAPGTAEAAPQAAGGAFGTLARLVEMGGPVIVVLLILSVLALAIVLAKLVQFARSRAWAHDFVDPVARTMHSGDFAGAQRLLGGTRGPVATVMRAALAGRAAGERDETVREEVDRIAQAEIDALERGLPQLSLIATISPLLGLLGTVTGLIDSFQQLADAGDRVDPAILSGGIWEALLTTVLGLVVAIPAATLFSLLQRSVDLTARRMEDAATRVFTVDLYRRSTAVDGVRPDAPYATDSVPASAHAPEGAAATAAG